MFVVILIFTMTLQPWCERMRRKTHNIPRKFIHSQPRERICQTNHEPCPEKQHILREKYLNRDLLKQKKTRDSSAHNYSVNFFFAHIFISVPISESHPTLVWRRKKRSIHILSLTHFKSHRMYMIWSKQMRRRINSKIKN